MKSGSKKDTNELLNESASIECRYSLELSKSKKKAQVLRLGGVQYSSIIATTSMIFCNNKAMLTTEQFLEEMHIQWHLVGGKSREDNAVVSSLDRYHTNVLMYCTMVLLACQTKVRL